MPLALDLEPRRLGLLALGEALFEGRDPIRVEELTRRTVARTWDDDLQQWVTRTLDQMELEYRDRVAYIHDAIADLEARGSCSHVVRPLVARLAEKLIFEARVDVDYLDEIEQSLVDGTMDPFDAVIRATVGAAGCLDVTEDETARVVVASLRATTDLPDAHERFPAKRAARLLDRGDRRERVRTWAAGFVEALAPRYPALTAAVASAGESELNSVEDPIWLGAVRGILIRAHGAALANGVGPSAAMLS